MDKSEEIPQVKSFEAERLDELRDTLKVVSNWMVLPLYFLFWICDVIYVPNLKWEFLTIRALVIPLCFVVWILLPRVTTFRKGEWLALAFTIGLASAINLMIFLIGDFSSFYYAGLNLVALGSLTFMPWSRGFFMAANVGIFAPYYVGSALWAAQGNSPIPVAVHSFFMVGTVVIPFVIRSYHETLRKMEFASRGRLHDEVLNREEIIAQKSREAVRLEGM